MCLWVEKREKKRENNKKKHHTHLIAYPRVFFDTTNRSVPPAEERSKLSDFTVDIYVSGFIFLLPSLLSFCPARTHTLFMLYPSSSRVAKRRRTDEADDRASLAILVEKKKDGKKTDANRVRLTYACGRSSLFVMLLRLSDFGLINRITRPFLLRTSREQPDVLVLC